MNKVLHLILLCMLIFINQIQCLYIKHNQDNPIIYRLPSEKKETMIYKSETTQPNDLKLQNYPIQMHPLINYILSDPQLSSSATSDQPLSEQSANKLREYVESNQNLTNLLYKIFANLSPNQKCFMNLNEQDKQEIKKQIIHQIDWKNVLKDFHNQMVGEEQVHKICQQIKQSDQISQDARKCFQDTDDEDDDDDDDDESDESDESEEDNQ